MSDLQFKMDNRASSGKSGGIGGTVFLVLFATPFAGFGLFAAVQGIKKLVAGEVQNGLALCIFGLVFAGVGFGLMYAAIWARKKARQNADLLARNPGKPWLLRPDWAAGKIKSSTLSQVKMQAIMAVIFCGMGGLFTVGILPKELAKGNHLALVILIFPAIGVAMLVAVVRGILAQRRFGDCYFEMAQVPAPLGGTLGGMIQIGARLKPEHGLHLKLACVRREVSGSGKNQNAHETVLWQDEKVFKPEASLPEFAPGQTGIPVCFRLPADQPETFAHGSEAVCWRLEATTKMSGPDFRAIFEMPVFRIAGLARDPIGEPDPTAGLQMPAEELRQDEHSKIQVTSGPGGREFYFPAARNIGAALFTTLLAGVFDGGVILILHFHGPVIFAIFLGLFGVILTWSMLNLWFKSSRVTINSTGVTTVNRWLILSRTRQFDASGVARFEAKPGTTSGTKMCLDIKLVTRTDGDSFEANKARYLQTGQRAPMKFKMSSIGGVTMASDLASAPEAEWLAQEMTKALGRE